MLTPKQWKLLEALYLQALDLPKAEWLTFLETQVQDAVLRDELMAMLEANEHLPHFLQHPSPEPLRIDASHPRIDGYRILHLLGWGGMGIVYLAEPTEAFVKRRVALKVMRATLTAPSALQRFRMEHDVLSLLEHPNIARLYESGTTPAGQPYFVMEYVDGQSLSEYVTTHALSLPERLTLLRQIVDVVAFAHSHLILHRDLKPTNIMVRADGTAMLLDFGVAKLLDANQPIPDLTQTHGPYFSPKYASPEQILQERLTTASDLYSLGVIAFELLTGRLPYTSAPNSSSYDFMQEITEEAPPLMSRVSEATPASDLRGDLDSIVAKLLSKVPKERYASASALLADLDAYEAGFPVSAATLSLPYEVKRFFRRRGKQLAQYSLLVAITACLVWLFAVMIPAWLQDRKPVEIGLTDTGFAVYNADQDILLTRSLEPAILADLKSSLTPRTLDNMIILRDVDGDDTAELISLLHHHHRSEREYKVLTCERLDGTVLWQFTEDAIPSIVYPAVPGSEATATQFSQFTIARIDAHTERLVLTATHPPGPAASVITLDMQTG